MVGLFCFSSGTSDTDSEKRKEEKKTLPELEKYWKAVKDDSTDFTGWTYLLQYVDQEVRRIRRLAFKCE